MVPPYNCVVPAVYGFFAEAGKVLLLRREGTDYGAGLLCLPAGHLEGGEDAIRGLRREMREELGVQVAADDCQLTVVLHRAPTYAGDVESLDLVFRVRAWQGEPRIMEPDKCSELKWVDPQALPDDVLPYIPQTLDAVRDHTPLLTIGWTAAEE